VLRIKTRIATTDDISDLIFRMKIIATYFLLFFLPILSLGQTQIGIKGGYIYYWFTNPDDGRFTADYDYSHNAGLVAITVRQKIPQSILNLVLEIEYANRSFSLKSSWGGLGSGQNANYSYTIGNIYLHFQPQFTFGSKVKFFIYPGFYFGTLLNSKLTGSYSYWQMGNPPVAGTEKLNGTARGNYPTFEFGIYPGLGIEFPMYKKLNFTFEYNFNMNFLSIADSWGSDKVKMLNMNFEIGLAYTINRNNKQE
jgi:hypothetical protein